jgi:hypothetical protein
MSMEIYVLSDRRLASFSDWQEAIEAEGFGLKLSTERSLDDLRGHLPAQLGDEHAGFECDHWDADALMEGYPGLDYGHRWQHALAFRFGGDVHACLGAYMAATAYARATAGIVLECEELQLLVPQQALATARAIEQFVHDYGGKFPALTS